MKTLLPVLFLLFGCTLFGQKTIQKSNFTADNTQNWQEVEPFKNGFARVLKDDQFSFININGQSISSTFYTGARNFSNHFAAVQQNEKWGFINEIGQLIVPCEYDLVYDFNSKFTIVLKDSNWYKINHQGETIKQLNIDICYGFENDMPIVSKNGQMGILSSDDDFIYKKKITSPVPFYTLNQNNTTSRTTSECPNNLDFENGNFTGWSCFTGSVDTIGTVNRITVTPSAPINNRHRIIRRSMPSAIDPFGLFSINPPDGSNVAVRLGNTSIGAQAERISYKIRVPQNDSNFSIKYNYAVVFEDPNHTAWSQPRFVARLFDSAANAYVSCASFEYISTSSLPGFARSTVDTAVIYKPWSSVFISLRAYVGRTMYIEFTTADCVRRGHWGYAYLDVESTCGEALSVNYNCNYPNITELNAPPGFQTYNWWNQSFSNLLANGENAVLNPGPPSGSILWLEMIPFNNFGCRDTVKVNISGAFSPTFQSTTNNAPCAPYTITFFNESLPASQVVWNFGDGTTGSGDTVNHTYLTPGNYQVSMTVTLANGCVGTTSENVIINQPTGTLNYTGGNFCGNKTIAFDVSATNATSYTWEFGDGSTVTTAQSTISHTYVLEGNYIPKVTINFSSGCVLILTGSDSVSIDKIDADFTYNAVQFCGYTTVNFTSISTSTSGIASYSWNFGNGSIGNNATETQTFTTSGTRNIKLIVTNINGCVDSINKLIRIDLWNYPNGNISGPNAGCAGDTMTFNHNYNSLDSLIQLEWFTDQGSSSTSNQANFVFNTPGTHWISLIVVNNHGCSDTLTKSILINPIPVFTQPQDITICNGTLSGSIELASLYPGGNFSWSNDNTSIGLSSAGNWNIPTFIANNNSNTTVQANITLSVIAQGCSFTAPSFLISVQPTPQVDQPTNQTLCNNSATSAIVFTSNSNPNYTYSWQNNTPSIGLVNSGMGNISAFTAVNTSTTPVNATITVTPQFNGCAGIPKSFYILVNPTPNVSAPSNQTVCNGTQLNAIQFSVNPSNASISWTNTQTSIGLAASGTGNINSFQAENTTGNAVTSNISVIPNFQGCVGNAQNFTIQVNPTPTVDQPTNQILCNGSATSAIVFTNTSNPNYTYSWQNNTPSIGLASSGVGSIAAFTASNTGSTPINANITVTPQFNGCVGTPKSFNILVNPTPNVSAPSNNTVCNGTQINAIQFSVNPSNATVNWTNTQTSIGLAATGTGNITSFQALNTTGTAVTSNISVRPNFQGCVGNAQNFTIQVNPTPTVDQPTNQTLCFGAATTLINFNSSITGTTFSWNNNNTNIGLTVTGSGNISPFTPINHSTFSDTAFITVMPVLNGCNGLPKSFFIALAPNINFTLPTNQTYCNGQTTSLIDFNLLSNGSSINWVNSNASIGLASSGTGNILPFVATNSSNLITNANIIVTSTYLNCPAISHSFNIQVNPSLTIQQPANIEVCPGQTINQIQFIGNVSGASYTWSNTNTNIGLAANGVGNIASFTALNNSSVSINAQITVIGVSNGCTPAQRIFSINVNPSPVINNILDVVVCHGKITDTIFLEGPNVGTQYSWTNSNPSIGLVPRGIGHIMPFLATNHTTEMQSGLIEILGVTPAHCTALVKVFKIFVNPIPRLAANNDINICRGSNASLSVSGANSYSWTPVNGLSCSNCSNPTVTASATTTYFIEGTNASGCKSVDSIKVNVNQPFDMIVSPNDTVCVGKSFQLNANRATRYQWSPATGLNNPNIANPIATPSTSTTYTVVGYDAMGCFTDTASVYLMIGQNPSVNVGPDISAQTGSVITLNSNVSSGPIVSYNWSPSNNLSCNNCPNPSLTITGNQMLTLTVQNKYGCTAVDSLYIVTFCKNAQVFVANAFTPDGDNINDMLIVRGTGISVKSFRVFNRWGNVVFEKQHFQPNDPKFGWNGKVNGVPATPDVYVYIAEVACDNGTVYFHKGNTTILK